MYGNFVVLDEQYRVKKVVKAGNGRLASAHEFRIVDGGKEGRVLVEVPVVRARDLREFGGEEGQVWVVDGGFQGKFSFSFGVIDQ